MSQSQDPVDPSPKHSAAHNGASSSDTSDRTGGDAAGNPDKITGKDIEFLIPNRRIRDVLMLLPPDFYAPQRQKLDRFPNQGPALVAASVSAGDLNIRAQDLELELNDKALDGDHALFDDLSLVGPYLRGENVPEIEYLVEDMLSRIPDFESDGVAISLDRHTQIAPSAALAVALKRRTGKPVLVGGTNAKRFKEFLEENDVQGIDLVTKSRTPDEIRAAFTAFDGVPDGRFESAVEPVLGGLPTEPRDWPIPDYAIYDLDRYRRDPIANTPGQFKGYRGEVGPVLVLPYHFTHNCQFACAFCNLVDGDQTSKTMDHVARDLATMAERYNTRHFFMVDNQINLFGSALADALISAKVDVQWTNSYRVVPYTPGEVEKMAQSGCVGLTVGVESGSDGMLRKMVKGHRVQHATRLIREAHANNIMVRVNMVTCFPGERPEDHVVSREWLCANADAIDDISPSSFYLTPDSPVALKPERFGIRLRNQRDLTDEYKFRKAQSSREYDEIDGRRWEELEPLLRESERDMYDHWVQARRDYGPLSGLRPGLMFAARQGFPTKKDALDTMVEWTVGRRPSQPSDKESEQRDAAGRGRRRYRSHDSPPGSGGNGPSKHTNPTSRPSAPKIFRPSKSAETPSTPKDN